VELNLHSLENSYPSERFPAYGRRGMVATSNAYAAQAGLDMLKKGGNAVDAALAAAACLTVCEPTANGIGGDAFAIVAFEGNLYGLNASGPAPRGISLEALVKQGYKEIPRHGFVPVNVPGAPAGWAALSRRFGRLPLTEVFAPAVAYAEEGYAVSTVLARQWNRAFEIYKERLQGEEFSEWFRTFAPEGRAPRPGEVVRLAGHAETLQQIAETMAEAFYRGEIAERIDGFSRKYGGFLRAQDLAGYEPEWVEPIGTEYRGLEVWEIPPNGQGIVALMALNILKGFEFAPEEKNSPLTWHRQIEALKLAFADAQSYVTDPKHMQVSVEDLLSAAWADEKRKLIGSSALLPPRSEETKGGTVYLTAADAEGNMVSLIQSNYMGFGSGLVVPGTGIALHNRGHNFSFDPKHHNCLAPGKKTYHTIIPGFLTKNGLPLGPFGVMGGFMQPQGHVQLVMNLADFRHNPQGALDGPRFQWMRGRQVQLEKTVPESIVKELEKLGHEITVTEENSGYGRGQIILRLENGTYVGGTESRVDGMVAVW
jgi:gamma-glutamyltranspeptidase/glutathione hydrolase